MILDKTLRKLFSALILLFGMASQAQAGLIEVKTIEISNSIGEWLQVAEVIAKDTSGSDVALLSAGATASAPDSWDSCSTADKAIDGNTDGVYGDCEIYHEASPKTLDTLTVTLPSLTELMSIAIWGRTDCCRYRDIYSVVFKDASGAEVYSIASLDARSTYLGRPGFAMLPDTRVPEPGTLALLGIGLAGIGLARRRRF